MSERVTTIGRLQLQDALPKEYHGTLEVGGLTGKSVEKLMTRIAQERPQEYVDILDKLNNIGIRAVSLHGKTASLQRADLDTPEEIVQMRDKMMARIQEVQEDDLLDADEKEDVIKNIVLEFSKTVDDDLFAAVQKRGGSLAEQIKTGSRGNKTQLRQMLLGNLLSSDSDGNIIPYPALRGFAEGATQLGYWSGCHGSRKGYVDLQLGTAEAGYFGKLISNVAHRGVVTEDDCGTEEGIEVEGDDADNVGAVLQEDVNGVPRGTLIKEEHIPLLKGKQIRVRSAISCRAAEGVCSKCAGLRENGQFAQVGDNIGTNAARSFIEPLTQSVISAKHKAGEFASSKNRQSGFAMVKQFMQVPDEYPGGSVLAQAEGKVGKARKAPQGGQYITVGLKEHYIPGDRELKVKPGDEVEAGDELTDGLLNPKELVRFKGLGEGRRYFLSNMRKMLDANNAGTNRRNLEILSQQFLNRVRIVDPEGYNGHLPGDVVPYNSVLRSWEPREGNSLKSISAANKLYLEKPYLHYTVGTQVTPSVSKTLKNAGVKQVLVHPKPPPWQPDVIRVQDFLSSDEDVFTQLAGENMKKTLVRAASVGGTSDKKSVSYFPRLVNITEQ